MIPDSLDALKDDMIAFIEGHGMRTFPAKISEGAPRVCWDDPALTRDAAIPAPDASTETWKDFVEMAKAVGAPMVCLVEDRLDRATIDLLSDGLRETLTDDDSLTEEAEKLDELFRHADKIGFIELAFAHQGVLFAHQTSTDWYRDYKEMVDTVDALQSLIEDALDSEEDEPRT